MFSPSRSFLLPRTVGMVTLFSLFLLSTPPIAHPQVDSIRASPHAVQLRSIWSLRGDWRNNDKVGAAVAGLWDIDGDDRDEFAVLRPGDFTWTIYGLDADRTGHVVQTLAAHAPDPLFYGDFRGDGRPLLARPWVNDSVDHGRLYSLELFDVDSGRVAEQPAHSWYCVINGARMNSPGFHVADLDLDGADELILSSSMIVREEETNRNGELWIYRGGADFALDTPDVIVRDDAFAGSAFELYIGRIDEDAYPDLVSAGIDGRIRWGGPDLAALRRPVDRGFQLPSQFMWGLLDADGDGRSDMLWLDGYLHLSSSGKDPRTRPFDAADADRHFVGASNAFKVGGPLNDSAGRYDMITVPSGRGDDVEFFLSGSADGPDADYDAWYSASADGLGGGYAFRASSPTGDVDGNGWRDIIGGDREFNDDGGIAMVIGGGPHIPRDSMPASAIRDITVDGRREAITIWPNPATDVVHVAWRGDLRRTPERFTVYDALGRLVAAGVADHSRGEVLWRCAEQTAGLYVVIVYDRSGAVVASDRIVIL